MRTWCVSMVLIALARPAWSQVQCPNAEYLPQLTIDTVRNPAIPVIDDWQVLWRDVPLSDVQVAALAQNDSMIDLTRSEMAVRGTWVYIGMLVAVAGAVVSSVGWYLLGNDKSSLPRSVGFSMALGGIIVGGGGVLAVTESIQRPLEPVLAPTPVHRLTREQTRELVTTINRRLYDEVCAAVEKTAISGAGATSWRDPSPVHFKDTPAAPAPAPADNGEP
jgi:hypothetical protein